MPLIPLVNAEHARPEVAQLYAQIEQAFGMIPDGAKLLANSPFQLEHALHSIAYYEQHPRLSEHLRLFIRLLVAQSAHCYYCIDMNESMLINAGVAVEAVQAAKQDPSKAPLPPAELTLLTLALKAAKSPLAVDKADMDGARAAGWSDSDTLDAIGLAALSVAFDIIISSYHLHEPMPSTAAGAA